jgi:hypothetical protein
MNLMPDSTVFQKRLAALPLATYKIGETVLAAGSKTGRLHQAHLAIIPGELLFQLYTQYGARLLEHNVRSFLQAKGKVNRGILNTLKTEPARFMAYNNGISITAQEVEVTASQWATRHQAHQGATDRQRRADNGFYSSRPEGRQIRPVVRVCSRKDNGGAP